MIWGSNHGSVTLCKDKNCILYSLSWVLFLYLSGKNLLKVVSIFLLFDYSLSLRKRKRAWNEEWSFEKDHLRQYDHWFGSSEQTVWGNLGLFQCFIVILHSTEILHSVRLKNWIISIYSRIPDIPEFNKKNLKCLRKILSFGLNVHWNLAFWTGSSHPSPIWMNIWKNWTKELLSKDLSRCEILPVRYLKAEFCTANVYGN